ncbi:MAG: DUF5004 domain-containing protein [Cyclobacteriaceae bacterium]|nr:DUF5004 domain-containing protein [Cyclobacteriaceae bacterium]
MKLIVAFTLVFAFVAGCSEDASLTEEQRVTALLSGESWEVNRVEVDGQDKSDLFADFSLQFKEDKTYTSTGITRVWARSGTWQFTDPINPTVLLRDDGVEVTLETLSEQQLVLVLNWSTTTISGGRGSSVRGNHRFVLQR